MSWKDYVITEQEKERLLHLLEFGNQDNIEEIKELLPKASLTIDIDTIDCKFEFISTPLRTYLVSKRAKEYFHKSIKNQGDLNFQLELYHILSHFLSMNGALVFDEIVMQIACESKNYFAIRKCLNERVPLKAEYEHLYPPEEYNIYKTSVGL